MSSNNGSAGFVDWGRNDSMTGRVERQFKRRLNEVATYSFFHGGTPKSGTKPFQFAILLLNAVRAYFMQLL